MVYTIGFPVTPHLLRHTYISNLIHAGVNPKTVQHLAGHKNSKFTMNIYAKVKYNKPEQLSAVVNETLEK
ncbi:MAG: tyrosine-type recombinase/integrase [Blautia sp.]|nr:tyrosine-type recombinase/integrase [Blautia sp.]